MLRPADIVKDYLMDGLSTGALVAGQKLPTERELAMRFHVSRTVVRDALNVLEAERRIVRHVGRGTFVAGDFPTEPPWALPTSARADTSPSKLMEARAAIESELAALAVLNATEADLKWIRTVCQSLGEAAAPEDFEREDAEFHRAIAIATHNALLLNAYDLVAHARGDPEWRKLKAKRHLARPDRRLEVLEEHQAILVALEERDATAAREAVLAHLSKVRANILGY